MTVEQQRTCEPNARKNSPGGSGCTKMHSSASAYTPYAASVLAFSKASVEPPSGNISSHARALHNCSVRSIISLTANTVCDGETTSGCESPDNSLSEISNVMGASPEVKQAAVETVVEADAVEATAELKAAVVVPLARVVQADAGKEDAANEAGADVE